MKYSRFAALAAAMVMSVNLYSCSIFPEEEEMLAPPLTAPAAVTYRTHTVARGDIVDSVILNGTFVSNESYELSFEKRAGYLSEINVEAGDYVTQGQVLAKLDTDSLETAFARAQYNLRRLEIKKVLAMTAIRDGDENAAKEHLSYLRKNGGLTVYKHWADSRT